MSRLVYVRPLYMWPVDTFVRACVRIPDEIQLGFLMIVLGAFVLLVAVLQIIHFWMYVWPVATVVGVGLLIWKFVLPRIRDRRAKQDA